MRPMLSDATIATPVPAGLRAIGLCVDDYGLHSGIDEASVRLAELGRISAVSVMSGGPTWRVGAAALRALPPEQLDVGLHLNFSESVGDSEPFWSLRGLILRSHARLLPTRLLQASIRRQLDRLVQALGRAPAHVDGHQHVQQLPQIREQLLQVLAEELDKLGVAPGSAAAPWLRCGSAPDAADLPERRKARLIDSLGATTLRQQAGQRGWRCNGHLLGVYGFGGDAALFRARLLQWASLAQTGDLIMCHPATQTTMSDPIAAARRREYEVLSAADLPEQLAEQGVCIRPLSQVLG
jgi:predicted glycoside hydrolase/deacetylase ChbG (UPF0249 family)